MLIVLAIVAIAFHFLNRQKTSATSPSSALPQVSRTLNQMWGEPAKAMFPDIEKPRYVATQEANSFLRDKDLVIDLSYGQTHYIYPVNILSFHHIVNDIVGGKPIAVTYCLLTDSLFVYSRKLGDETLDLGVLGPLYYGNLVMYDKNSDSYVIQMTGEIFQGPLSGKTLTVEAEPAITAWKYVKDDASAKVLAPEKPIAFYRDFYETRKSSQMGLQSLTQKGGKPDLQLEPYTRGIGVRGKRESAFVPLSSLEEKGAVIVKLDNKNASVQLDDKTGRISVTGDQRFNFTPVYWFAWAAFYPNTGIYSSATGKL